MENIQPGVGGPFLVQISIGGPGEFARSTGGVPNSTPDAPSEDGGNDRSHAMQWLIGVLVEMTLAGGSTFQAARSLPKPFLVTFVAISLVLVVLDLVLLLVLLLCAGQSLTRFAKRGAMVMIVLVMLLALITYAYAAL